MCMNSFPLRLQMTRINETPVTSLELFNSFYVKTIAVYAA